MNPVRKLPLLSALDSNPEAGHPRPGQPRTIAGIVCLFAALFIGYGAWLLANYEESPDVSVSPPDSNLLAGYPISDFNRKTLVTLFHERKFKELDAAFERVKKLYAGDYRYELFLSDLSGLLYYEPASQDTERLLGAWIAAAKKSAVPHIVAAVYFEKLGFAARGANFAEDTPPENFEKMKQYHRLALAHAEGALAIDKKAIVPYRVRIAIQAASGAPFEVRYKTLNDAIEACPQCILVRRRFFQYAGPRWQMSMEQMERVAQEAQAHVKENPRLRSLLGFIELERAEQTIDYRSVYDVQTKSRLLDALKHLNTAVEYGPEKEFLTMRGHLLIALGRHEEAFEDFSGILAQLPSGEGPFVQLAQAKFGAMEWNESVRFLNQARALVPEDAAREAWASRASVFFIEEGNAALERKATEAAVENFRLAHEFDPKSEKAQELYSKFGPPPPQPENPATAGPGH